MSPATERALNVATRGHGHEWVHQEGPAHAFPSGSVRAAAPGLVPTARCGATLQFGPVYWLPGGPHDSDEICGGCLR